MERHAIFPLNIFLLPGEITYLHIFEPRYKQLLEDVERDGIPFGIYFQGTENRLNIGTMVELEKVIKRHPGGELDISVRAKKIFKLEWFFENLNDKLYPGGEIEWPNFEDQETSEEVFNEFKILMDIKKPDEIVELPIKTFEVAALLNLRSKEKLELVQMKSPESQDKTLLSHIRLYTAIARQENDSHFNFNLN
jgi:Lon protease-like protein